MPKLNSIEVLNSIEDSNISQDELVLMNMPKEYEDTKEETKNSKN